MAPHNRISSTAGFATKILAGGAAVAVLALTATTASAAGAVNSRNNSSPVRGIDRDLNETNSRRGTKKDTRNIDGSGNNRYFTEDNAAGTQLRRLIPSDYADSVSQLAGANRPNARQVSNAIASQYNSQENAYELTDFLWQWGQFLDHDIDLTDGTVPVESAEISVPSGDLHFDPQGTGSVVIPFNRSAYDPETGTGPTNPRQQINEISGWIDASNVYGSTEDRASALRRNDGSGKLKTSAGRLLPFNVDGLPNAGGRRTDLFLAGDVRANEQAGLTAMHTLFVREHNRWARRIGRANRGLTGDQVYERARRLVGAQMQKITYEEFLPALLGDYALRPYTGYDPTVDSRISNEFSTAAYRFGHSLLSPTLRRVNRKGREVAAGHLPLRDAFFAPDVIVDHGIESLLRGLASQRCQDLDAYVIDDVRNFLFGEPGRGGFDLASLNIQRGRDHGLPSYNDTREALGLPRASSFAAITTDPHVEAQLASVYGTPDNVDLWAGGISEEHVPGAMVGETFFIILKHQFEALRDGDRFWYQNSLSRKELRELRRSSLAQIIRRNTRIGRELQKDVFRMKR